MPLTRTQLINQVLLNLQEQPGNVVETQIKNVWLPLVLQRIADSRKWAMLETVESMNLLSAGTTVDLPSDLRTLINVRLDNGDDSKTITPIAYTEFDRYQHSVIEGGTTTGPPMYCTRYGPTLEFSPPSDDGYTISARYVRSIDEMGSDAAICEIPHIDDILVAEVTAWGYMQLQNDTQAGVWKAIAKRLWMEHDGEIDGESPVMRLYQVGVRNRGPDRWYT